VSFQGELEILPVTLSLAARSDHLITITLSCGGYLSAQVGAMAASAVLSLSATFDVGVTVASTNGYLVPSLDLSAAWCAIIAFTAGRTVRTSRHKPCRGEEGSSAPIPYNVVTVRFAMSIVNLSTTLVRGGSVSA
jgi:hypothetical protein